jgi:hypothetical protein
MELTLIPNNAMGSDPIADGSPDTVFPTVISEVYSYAPLLLNSGGGRPYTTSR